MDCLAPDFVEQYPEHGRIPCRRCFVGLSGLEQKIGPWKMVNDPGAWGSGSPEIIVLGFSKGFTQATAYQVGKFEDVPFKRMRPRLTETLRLLGLLQEGEIVDGKMRLGETRFAFGSLVRCSLSRLNGNGKYGCTGPIMAKSFTEEISTVVRRCAENFLSNLSPSTKLILMLGTGSAYVGGCKKLISSIYGAAYLNINAVSYRTGNVIWTHISHPSGSNGWHPQWMAGDRNTPSGLKRRLAADAVKLALQRS